MLPDKNYKSQSNRRGFSMIEVIFSVFIMSVGLVATVGLISSSINNSIDSRNHVVASQLAQEGVELVRNIRDNNWASGNPSFNNLATGGQCRISYDSALHECAPTEINNNNGYYTLSYVGNFFKQDVSNNTRFARRIIIEDRDGSEAKQIYSIVSWNNEYVSYGQCTTANKCVSAEAKLTKWDE